MTYYAVIAIKM